jgi:hypothetical protein
LLSRNDYFLMPKARRVLKGQPERSLLEIRSFDSAASYQIRTR